LIYGELAGCRRSGEAARRDGQAGFSHPATGRGRR
jgi:hypothetical protein